MKLISQLDLNKLKILLSFSSKLLTGNVAEIFFWQNHSVFEPNNVKSQLIRKLNKNKIVGNQISRTEYEY